MTGIGATQCLYKFRSWGKVTVVTSVILATGPITKAQSRPLSSHNLLLYDIGRTNPETAAVITTFDDFLPPDWNITNRTDAFEKVFGFSDFARSWIRMPGVLRSPNPVTGAMDEAYLQPKCGNDGLSGFKGAALEVSTFMKPYDVYQGSIFLPYLRQHTGLTDFLPAAARARSAVDGMPPYKGNLACPTILPNQMTMPTPGFLRKTYGQAAVLKQKDIRLIIDNAFNPFRWDGNIGNNSVMHREQSTLGLGFPVSPQGIAKIRSIFQELRIGLHPVEHVMLSYDISMSIEPAPGISKSETMADMLDHACTAKRANHPHNLFQASICFDEIGKGSSPSWKLMKAYLAYRLQAPSVQLSIGVVLDNGAGDFPWRDQEFMLASYNYKDTHPQGFAATGNTLVNANTPIGNSNGRNAAWYRTRISAFHEKLLYDPGWPIVSGGASDWVIQTPDGSRHLTGTIDLTDYIHNFSERHLIPGMSGKWGGCNAALPLDTPAPKIGKPNCDSAKQLKKRGPLGVEPLSVYRIFIVPEIHGPYYVHISVKRLSLFLSNSGLQ